MIQILPPRGTLRVPSRTDIENQLPEYSRIRYWEPRGRGDPSAVGVGLASAFILGLSVLTLSCDNLDCWDVF